jgi:hypothetical protein
MKTTVLVSVLMAPALILSLAVPAASTDDRNFDPRYNVMAERMVDGEAAGPEHVTDGIVFFPLRTRARVIQVELGPKDFVRRIGLQLKAGEMVTVLGVPAKAGENRVLLAREVRTMRALFVVRDRNGRPMWDVNRPVEMDPEISESTLCEMVMP